MGYTPGPRGLTEDQRFWQKVDKKSDDECWNWTGGKVRGYGQMRSYLGNSGRILSHNFSWILHNGEVPNGKCVLHKCDNNSCVNPNHLYIGTESDNAHDRWRRTGKSKTVINN